MVRKLSLPLVFGILSFACLGAESRMENAEHFDFAPGGTIRLNHSFGDLYIEAWDQPRVEITVTKSMGFDISGPDAKRGLDSVHVVSAQPSSRELTITTTRTQLHNRFARSLGIGREPTVEYRICVPRDSHLAIVHDGGQISVTGVSGSIEAATGTNRRNRLHAGEYYSQTGAPDRHFTVHAGFGGIAMKDLK